MYAKKCNILNVYVLELKRFTGQILANKGY